MLILNNHESENKLLMVSELDQYTFETHVNKFYFQNIIRNYVNVMIGSFDNLSNNISSLSFWDQLVHVTPHLL